LPRVPPFLLLTDLSFFLRSSQPIRAKSNTSSIVLTGISSSLSRYSSGMSTKSFWHFHGMMTVLIFILIAARHFSFTPPYGKTFPVRVISPVMATVLYNWTISKKRNNCRRKRNTSTWSIFWNSSSW
jgi:hypothetical protein